MIMVKWLDIYDKENERFPKEQKIKLRVCRADRLVGELAKHFGVIRPDFRMEYQVTVGGMYYPTIYTKDKKGLISISRDCLTLGYLYHEFAHHLNYVRNDRRGHGKDFWKCLLDVYASGIK